MNNAKEPFVIEITNGQKFVDGLRQLQKDFAGEADRLGLKTEDDVVQMIKELRKETRNEKQIANNA